MSFSIRQRFISATRRPHADMEPKALEWFGLDNLCRSAKAWNRLRHHREWSRRRRLYREHFTDLLEENGSPQRDVDLVDGWAMDDSATFPHLDRLLEEAGEFIAERGGKPRTRSERGFIRDLVQPGDLERWESILDFATSSDILAPICRHMKTIPVLSNLVPPGVRFVESTNAGQIEDGVYRQSQLYHLDFHDRPVVYVVVLLHDITPEHGPLVFLPRSASDRVRSTLAYGRRKRPYRVTDEAVYGVVDANQARAMQGKRGTVNFLESSACFHYGSRDSAPPRYQLMLAYVSPCRTDFADRYMPSIEFPCVPDESRLRALVLGHEKEDQG